MLSIPNFQGVKSGAEIAVSHDGRFVYVEDKPWGFGIDASGKWLLVANQRSGKVNVFSVDTASGMVTDTGKSAAVASPSSVAFVK